MSDLLRNSLDLVARQQQQQAQLREEEEARNMWAPVRNFHATRVGMDINSQNMDLAQARSSGRMEDAKAIEQSIRGLQQRQAMYAPDVGRVEDIGTRNGLLSDGLSWAGAMMGGGVASMMEPAAMAAAGTALSRVPGLGRLAPVAAGVGAFLFNQQQGAGNHYGILDRDPEAMRRLGFQGAQDQANLVGAGTGVLNTVAPWMIGRSVGGAGLSRVAQGAGAQAGAQAGVQAAAQNLARGSVQDLSQVAAQGAVQRSGGMLGNTFGTRMAGGMAMEGGTELAEGELSRTAHAYANPLRDATDDGSNQLNELLGGAVGSTPMSAMGAAADGIYNRIGDASSAVQDAAINTFDAAKEKGTEVADKLNVRQIFDLGNDARKSVGSAIGDVVKKVKDFATGEDGRADWVGMHRKATEELQRWRMDQTEYDLLTAAPPPGMDYSTPEGIEWARNTFRQQDAYMHERLSTLAQQGVPEATELYQKLLDTPDPVDRQDVLDEATNWLLEKNASSRLRHAIASRDLVAGKMISNAAGKATRAAKKVAGAAAFTAGAVADGVLKEMSGYNDRGPKYNKQGTAGPKELNYESWRASKDAQAEKVGHSIQEAANQRKLADRNPDEAARQLEAKQGSARRATLFGEIMVAEAKKAQAEAEARTGLNRRAGIERQVRNADGSDNIEGLDNFVRSVAYELHDLTESVAGGRSRDTEKARAAVGVIDTLTTDLRLALRGRAVTVVENLASTVTQENPKAAPVLEMVLDRLRRPENDPEIRRDRQTIQQQMVGVMPRGIQQELLQDSGALEGMYNTISTLTRSGGNTFQREQIRDALGARVFQEVMEGGHDLNSMPAVAAKLGKDLVARAIANPKKLTSAERQNLKRTLGEVTLSDAMRAFSGESDTNTFMAGEREEFIDDSGQLGDVGEEGMDAPLGAEADDEGEYGTTESVSGFEARMKEKTAEAGSGAKLYGLNRVVQPQEDPFTAPKSKAMSATALAAWRKREMAERKIGGGEWITPQERPQLFMDKDGVEDKGFAARVKRMQAVLGPDFTVDKRTASQVIDERRMPADQRLAIFRDYLKEELKAAKKVEDTPKEHIRELEESLSSLNAAIGEAIKNPTAWNEAFRAPSSRNTAAQNSSLRPGDLNAVARKKTDRARREALATHVMSYFDERYMAVAERRIDRDSSQITVVELDKMVDKARRAIDAARKPGEGGAPAESMADLNILWFQHKNEGVAKELDAAAKKAEEETAKKDGAEAETETETKTEAEVEGKVEDKEPPTKYSPIRANDLVRWVRESRSRSESYDAEAGHSNRDRNEQFLTDLATGISIILDSGFHGASKTGEALAMPEMRTTFDGTGRTYSFKDGIPEILRLESGDYKGYLYGRRKQAEHSKSRRKLEDSTRNPDNPTNDLRNDPKYQEQLDYEYGKGQDPSFGDGGWRSAPVIEGHENDPSPWGDILNKHTARFLQSPYQEYVERTTALNDDRTLKAQAAKEAKAKEEASRKELKDQLIRERENPVSPLRAKRMHSVAAARQKREEAKRVEAGTPKGKFPYSADYAQAQAASRAKASSAGKDFGKMPEGLTDEQQDAWLADRRAALEDNEDFQQANLRNTRIDPKNRDKWANQDAREYWETQALTAVTPFERRLAAANAELTKTSKMADSVRTESEKTDLEVRSGGNARLHAGLGPEDKMTAAHRALGRANQLMDLANTEGTSAWLDAVARRLRTALGPEYDPETGMRGGLHYGWPLTHALSRQSLRGVKGMTVGQRKEVDMARSALIDAIDRSKVRPHIKLQMYRNLENDRPGPDGKYKLEFMPAMKKMAKEAELFREAEIERLNRETAQKELVERAELERTLEPVKIGSEVEGMEKVSPLATDGLTYNGRKYVSIAHAYHSNKTGEFNEAIYSRFSKVNPSGYDTLYRKGIKKAETDYAGRLLDHIATVFYAQNPTARAQLLSTGARRLDLSAEESFGGEITGKAFEHARTRLKAKLREREEQRKREADEKLYTEQQEQAAKDRAAAQERSARTEVVIEGRANKKAKDMTGPANVWHGSNDNAGLSNLAPRPFTWEGRDYHSVEHAYQSLKSGVFDRATSDRYSAEGGKKIVGGKGTNTENGYNLNLMAGLVYASFLQNPEAAKELLATGDRPITHRGGEPDVWTTKFPQILEAVRARLRKNKPPTPPDGTPKTETTAQPQAPAQPASKPANKPTGGGDPNRFVVTGLDDKGNMGRAYSLMERIQSRIMDLDEKTSHTDADRKAWESAKAWVYGQRLVVRDTMKLVKNGKLELDEDARQDLEDLTQGLRAQAEELNGLAERIGAAPEVAASQSPKSQPTPNGVRSGVKYNRQDTFNDDDFEITDGESPAKGESAEGEIDFDSVFANVEGPAEPEAPRGTQDEIDFDAVFGDIDGMAEGMAEGMTEGMTEGKTAGKAKAKGKGKGKARTEAASDAQQEIDFDAVFGEIEGTIAEDADIIGAAMDNIEAQIETSETPNDGPADTTDADTAATADGDIQPDTADGAAKRGTKAKKGRHAVREARERRAKGKRNTATTDDAEAAPKGKGKGKGKTDAEAEKAAREAKAARAKAARQAQAQERARAKARIKAASRPVTDEDIANAREYVNRVLGDQVRTEFEAITGYSGAWIEAEDAIRVSTLTMAGLMNVTRHEALHAFFSKFIKGNPKAVHVLRSLTDNQQVVGQLQRLLAHDPEALKQLKDGEERLAYIYQFSMAGMLKLPYSPGTTLMHKIRKFLRKVFQMVSDEERAVDLLMAFERGEMSKASTASKVIADYLTQGTLARKVLRKMDKFTQWGASMVMPAAAILANSVSPTARALERELVSNPGEEGSATGGYGYLNDRNVRMRQYTNLFRGIVDPLTQQQADELMHVMQAELPDDKIADPTVLEAKHKMRGLLDRFHKYMTQEKGVRMGRIRKDYFPVVWDADKLRQDPTAFRSMLLGKYREQVGEMAAKMEQRRQEWIERATTPEMRAERQQTEVVTPEYLVDSIYDSIVNVDGVESMLDDGLKPVKSKTPTPKRQDGVLRPWMAAGRTRALDFIEAADRERFLEKNLVGTMTRYVRQGVRTAEYSSRFGRTGVILHRKLLKIHKELGQAADVMVAAGDLKAGDARDKWVMRQYRDVANAVGAMEGTLGNDVSEAVRKINSWTIVYQNLRVLPLALFSSFVDPLGITVRSGQMRDAWNAFSRGIKAVVKQWGDMFSDGNGPSNKDKWERLAEMAGVIDSATFSNLLTDEYASVYLDGRAKRYNELLFKANGMEAWNRAMRVAATESAVKFMLEHNQGKHQHSARWMADLGFKVGQLPLDANGQLITNKAMAMAAHPGMDESTAEAAVERVHKAINRWVEGAILSPNASQRPAWGSDPRFGMFWHLKQFAYSFHQTILKRAFTEKDHGNYAPLGVLAWYIPGMIAADLVKNLAVGAGELPGYMKNYDLGDWVLHGAERSGIFGVGHVAIDGLTDPASLAGPAVDQLANMFTDPLQENIVRALPAHSLYSRALL